MEHFYTKIDGWFDFQSIYSRAVAEAKDGAHFVEVGAWLGKSAAFMTVEIINSGKNIRFDVVDNWQGLLSSLSRPNTYEDFCKNLSSVMHVLNPIRLDSVKAAKLYKNKSLDFVFIDAGHRYKNVRKDIRAWYPKVKDNGVIAGHDYSSDFPGVKEAVDEFFGQSKLELNSWVVKKKIL